MHLVFVPISSPELLKPSDFPSDESSNGAFYCVSKVTLGKHLRMCPGCQWASHVTSGLELLVPPLYL